MLKKIIMVLKELYRFLKMLYEKLSQNKILGVVVVLVLMAFVYSFCGCVPDMNAPNDDVVDDTYETIDGDYRVHVLEVEDTCSLDEDVKDRINRNYRMWVTVQEARGDGSYLADLALADLAWWDVEVTPQGVIDAEELLYNGLFVNHIAGLLTPDEIVATVTLNTMNQDDELVCYIVYELVGWPLFERATPPDRSELVEYSDLPLLPPVPDWAVDLAP